MFQTPDLSIIIVNWNSAAFLRKCLASIYAHSHGLSFETIVVDNASFDGCEEFIRQDFPTARFIQNKENLGFARANNLGFSHSKGRNLLFLNPDTEVKGRAIKTMLRCLEAKADAGIVGAKLLNSDYSIQTTCIRRFPTLLNQALEADSLRSLFPKSSLWGAKPLFKNGNIPAPVEAISGACMMVRRSVFERAGRFDSNYFMYSEDVDLCYKISQAGWKIYYTPDATVIHHGGGSSGAKRANTYAAVLMRQSRLQFMRMRRGRLHAAAYQWTMALVAVCRLILLGTLWLLSLSRVRRQSVQLALAKWALVLRWAVGLEGWAKPVTPVT